QLGAHTEKIVKEKRMRGRPRKVPGEERKPRIIIGKRKATSKKKNNAANRGFPVKFPKSLMPDMNLSQNQQKFENFRLGIVDKDGGQKIIELNCDTVKTAQPNNSNTLWSHTDAGTEGQKVCTTPVKKKETPLELDTTTADPNQIASSKNQSNDISKLFVPSQAIIKTPPTTITLPSISSLEKDYELASLIPSCPPVIGDVKNDQFFIPQSTFDQDGKTSMIIVGPFCMVCDPKPRLVLVSPEQQKKGPTMILRRKIHSPSNTPPRDFRIHKGTRYLRQSEKVSFEAKSGDHGDPATVLHDHDYMTPLELRDNVRRYCKAVAKHSANARFIDARVEDIREREDNYVVTIKGDNMLRRVKDLPSPSQAPMHNNEDGMPVVYNLSQIETSALHRAELVAKREEMVQESKQTGDYSQVLFPLSAIGDVVMEVLIPPGGTEFLPRPKVKNQE
ncbi:unnamed protein product, partial [Lymnaea stagnalis]